MKLAENIYRLRAEKNMSQGDLADALDVSRQSVSKWENGTAVPELEKLLKMSELFQVTLDELVGKTDRAKELPAENLPADPSAVTTPELISILMLIIGISVPAVILASGANSLFLMILALFVIPPFVTVCASLCTPKNKLLFSVFMVYDVVFGILAVVAGNVLAPFVAVLYVFAIAFWVDRLK